MDDDSPIAGTEVHYLDSEHVGAEYKIFVGHCGDMDLAPTAAPPAVLYLADANGLFASAVDTIRLMQLSAHLPPMLVVGIGYRMGGIADTTVIRARDLTPTYDPWFVRYFPEMTMMGGADKFLAFIRDELQPWVGSQYRIDPANSAFFGHSLGGLFATYALLTKPDTFRGYGIGSPSVWWQSDMMFEYEANYAANHDDLRAQAFFCVGEYEDHDGRQREAARLSDKERAAASLRYIDMVADTKKMADALRGRNYPGLELACEVFPGEYHITVPLLNLSRSLRNLFDAPR
jgi:hypothetical protein